MRNDLIFCSASQDVTVQRVFCASRNRLPPKKAGCPFRFTHHLHGSPNGLRQLAERANPQTGDGNKCHVVPRFDQQDL